MGCEAVCTVYIGAMTCDSVVGFIESDDISVRSQFNGFNIATISSGAFRGLAALTNLYVENRWVGRHGLALVPTSATTQPCIRIRRGGVCDSYIK